MPLLHRHRAAELFEGVGHGRLCLAQARARRLRVSFEAIANMLTEPSWTDWCRLPYPASVLRTDVRFYRTRYPDIRNAGMQVRVYAQDQGRR